MNSMAAGDRYQANREFQGAESKQPRSELVEPRLYNEIVVTGFRDHLDDD